MPKKNILVIEDEEAVRTMLCECLRDIGYEVSEAGDGDVGMRMIEKQEPQMVITDIIMPHKEGLETIMEIREKYPSIKLLAISGGGRSKIGDFLGLAQKLGADAVLQKPINMIELEEIVGRLVG